MSTTIVPLVSSNAAGPLGVVHLPRLWLKLSLAAHNQLPEGYDECGQGYDQMTLNALRLDRQKTIEFIRQNHPTYTKFEDWILAQNGGALDAELVKAHNAAVLGYNHVEELGAKLRAELGIKNANVKDAVTLNLVDDLDAFHRSSHGH